MGIIRRASGFGLMVVNIRAIGAGHREGGVGADKRLEDLMKVFLP